MVGARVSYKRCLVWGGGTGIGRAGAEALLQDGATVFLAGRRGAVVAEAAAALGAAGHAAGDATLDADVARVTAEAAQAMGASIPC